MEERKTIRVVPRAFDGDWRADLREAGVRVPEKVPELRYTPVGHDPVPFSLEIDPERKRLVKRIVGVMPNALYRGHMYTWEEFAALLRDKKEMSHGGRPQEEPDAVK